MAEPLFIAVDGGGTKTEFILFTGNGKVLKRLVAGGTNPNQGSILDSARILIDGLEKTAGLCEVEKVYCGIAGALSGDNATSLANALRKYNPVVESDIMNVFYSAKEPGMSVAVIMGTGSSVLGYDGERLHRFSGYGYLFEDGGSGYSIGRDIVKYCLEAEGIDTPLELERRTAARLGMPISDAIPNFYEKGPEMVASLAPIAIELAAEGNDLARRILRRNLSCLVLPIRRAFSKEIFGNKIVFSGGLMRSSGVLLPMLREILPGGIDIEVPDLPPIFGACKRALVLGNRDIPREFEQNFRETYKGGLLRKNEVSCPLTHSARTGSPTEERNERSMRLSTMETLNALALINEENRHSVEAVQCALCAIEKAVQLATKALASGGRIIYTGAGTSGRLAVLDASECPPTFGVDYETVVANMAGGYKALYQAVEEIEDKADFGARDMEARNLKATDLVVGISASGNAAYVIGALKYAKKLGVKTVSISSNADGAIGKIADIAVFTDTGAEVLTGSTRMKAGNAQKMVLNMITTMAMAKTGKVHGNLMSNMRATNKKLRERSERIKSAINEARA